MRTEANDLFNEATLGLALLALTLVNVQIDTRSMYRTHVPTILSDKKPAISCQFDKRSEEILDQKCKVNLNKKEVEGTSVFKKNYGGLDIKSAKHRLKP